jgi:ubiquinone/menaquinone biosynthesis C-methylase UbiE
MSSDLLTPVQPVNLGRERESAPAKPHQRVARQLPAPISKSAFGRVTQWLKRRVVEGVLLRRQAERLYLVFGGHIFFQTLHAGVSYGLFSLLKERPGLTRQQVAKELGIGEQPARIMILGLVAARLIRQRGRRLYNTVLSSELLCPDSPTNIIPYVYLQHHVMYPGMKHFCEALQAGRNVGLKEFLGDEPTLYQRLRHEPEVEQIFHDAMSALSVQTNAMLADHLDLSGVKHLVDVGGGDGTNIIALARRHPQLKASVFDFPSVCEIARERIAANDLAERLSAIEGNAFEDRFPQGADCFLFAHFCTIWSREKNKELFKRAYEALPSGGRVVIFNMMQHNDESGPLSAAVGSPYFLTIATGGGMLYTWNEYASWLSEAGFSDVTQQALPRDHGFVIGVKR